MRRTNPTRGLQQPAFTFNRLPDPDEYYREQGLKLIGEGECKSALCPFHNDTRPSIRVRSDNDTFRCMVSCTYGGDVYGLYFIGAAQLALLEVSR